MLKATSLDKISRDRPPRKEKEVKAKYAKTNFMVFALFLPALREIIPNK
jgi:hypothetical protein